MELAMALGERSHKRQRVQHGFSSLERQQRKKPKVEMAVEEDSRKRKWEEMNHDMLVIIMKCVARTQEFLKVCFSCKTWLSAMLDLLFPSGSLLDLRLFDDIPEKWRYERANFLKLVLNRSHQYTKLILPVCNLKSGAYEYIAQRMPALKCAVAPTQHHPSYFICMVPHWPELEEAHFNLMFLPVFIKYCKHISRLNLCGRIGDEFASMIASNFPRLVHLEIRCCRLSADALSIILEGQRNLIYLDTRHAYRIKDFHYQGDIHGRVMEWDADRIREKVATIKTYMDCRRRYCFPSTVAGDSAIPPPFCASYCSPLYSSKCSRRELAPFICL